MVRAEENVNMLISSTAGIIWFLADSAQGLFTINSNTGVISGTSAIDYESKQNHQIIVRASVGEEIAELPLSIEVINRLTPIIIDEDNAENRVREATAEVVSGLNLVVRDEDNANMLIDSTVGIIWSLADSAQGLFTINSNTGVISGTSAIDYESNQSHQIIVRASVGEEIADLPLTIEVINRLTPIIVDEDNAENRVREATAEVVSGLNLVVRDEDNANMLIDSTVGIVWSLADSAQGLFTINSNTGVISGTNAIDYESNQSHQIIVRVSVDEATADLPLTIEVTNRLTPIIVDEDTAENSVREATVEVVSGLSLVVRDEDNANMLIDSTVGIIWSLADSAQGLFTINSNTGVISGTSAIDYESNQSHQIIVQASVGEETAELPLSIDVINILRIRIIDEDSNSNNITEGTTGTVAGLSLVVRDENDANVVTGLIWTIVQNSPSSDFAIDMNTGIISASNRLSISDAQSYTLGIRVAKDDDQSTTINSDILSLIINVLKDLESPNLRLRLFLEGPLQ